MIDRPMRIFAPGFGAGAVAGYAVMRVDPEVVVETSPEDIGGGVARVSLEVTTSEDVRTAFGE